MAGTVEIHEIYQEEVHSPEGMYWFFSKGVRFLEVATKHGCELQLTIGGDAYLIDSVEKLVQLRGECLQHEVPVVCRVTLLK